MSKELLKYLSEKFEEEIVVLQDDMGMGKAQDFGDYKFAAGIIRGLRVAKNILMETNDKLREDD